MNRFAAIALVLVSLLPITASAQQADTAHAQLFKTVATLDSALFDAFNVCNVPAFENFFSEDLEFYHDYNGLSAPRSKTIEIISEECRARRLGRRELLPGTLEVHPLRGYGAIEIGVHRFWVRTPNGEIPGSTAKFIHVWRHAAGSWKIVRVLSFDHRK
ncbi:MAG: nuclear transport factor 2 family protein [Gemmatimonadota bacterium]